MSAWDNHLNQMPVDTHGALTERSRGRGRYPVDRYLIELGLVTLLVLITAVQCLRYASEIISSLIFTRTRAGANRLARRSKQGRSRRSRPNRKVTGTVFLPGHRYRMKPSVAGPGLSEVAVLNATRWVLAVAGQLPRSPKGAVRSNFPEHYSYGVTRPESSEGITIMDGCTLRGWARLKKWMRAGVLRSGTTMPGGRDRPSRGG